MRVAYNHVNTVSNNKAFQLMDVIAQVAEQEQNRHVNQLEIKHNLSQMSAEEYVNCYISTGTTE